MSNKRQSSAESAPTSKRVSSIAHDAIDNATEHAEEVEKKVRTQADRLAEKSSEKAADAKKRFDNSLNTVDGFVRERPFAAAGIAFAAGVIGALLIKK